MSHIMRFHCNGRANIGSSLLAPKTKTVLGRRTLLGTTGGGTVSLRCSASNQDEDRDVKKIPGLTKYTVRG